MSLKWIPPLPGDNPQNWLCTAYSIKALQLLTREERLGSLVRLRKTNVMVPSIEITAGGWRGRWIRGHIKVGSPSPDTHAREDHRSILRPGAIWAAHFLQLMTEFYNSDNVKNKKIKTWLHLCITSGRETTATWALQHWGWHLLSMDSYPLLSKGWAVPVSFTLLQLKEKGYKKFCRINAVKCLCTLRPMQRGRKIQIMSDRNHQK